MSQQIVTKCDVCSKAKGDLNRWVKYSETATTLTIGEGPNDCCSDACMKTLVARVMSNNRDREHISTEVQSVVENTDE